MPVSSAICLARDCGAVVAAVAVVAAPCPCPLPPLRWAWPLPERAAGAGGGCDLPFFDEFGERGPAFAISIIAIMPYADARPRRMVFLTWLVRECEWPSSLLHQASPRALTNAR